MTFAKWLHLIGQIQDAGGDTKAIECPSCSALGSIDFQYVGNAETRIGYVAVWCKKCNCGIQSSRAQAPDGFNLIPFGSPPDVIRNRIPNFDQVEPVSLAD